MENGFLKEATFQHLFNDAMLSMLPLANYIRCPELNTFATDSGGEIVTGELDFCINGELQWCLELLRLRDKIGGHSSTRFNDQVGKCREVWAKEYSVVDCRGPQKSGRGAQANEWRCALYFSER